LSALATASLLTMSRIAGNVADTQRAWWEGFVRGYGAGKGGIVSRRRKSALESKTRKDENGFGLAESAVVESMRGKVNAWVFSGNGMPAAINKPVGSLNANPIVSTHSKRDSQEV